MQNIPVSADFSVTRFFHVESGVEAARLAFFFQTRADLFAVSGHQIQIPFAKSLDSQYASHWQAFANFLLLIGCWPRRTGNIRHR